MSFHQRKEEERKIKKEITATLNIKSSSQVIKCNLTHELTHLPLASFTNTLCQSKLSFGIRENCTVSSYRVIRLHVRGGNSEISAARPVAYAFLGLPFLWCTMKENAAREQERLGCKTILKLNLSSVFAKLN